MRSLISVSNISSFGGVAFNGVDLISSFLLTLFTIFIAIKIIIATMIKSVTFWMKAQ